MTKEEKWRQEFKKLGHDAVKADLNSGGLNKIGGTLEKRKCAEEWVKEQQSKARRCKNLRDIFWGVVTLIVGIVTIIGVVYTVLGYHKG